MKHGPLPLALVLLAAFSPALNASELLPASTAVTLAAESSASLASVGAPALSPGFVVVAPAPSSRRLIADSADASATTPGVIRTAARSSELATLAPDVGRSLGLTTSRSPASGTPIAPAGTTPPADDHQMQSPMTGLAAVVLMICILIRRRNRYGS